MSRGLSAEQLDRYSRHVIMDDIGPTGQERLLDGSVLVIGAGGLGSPVLQYLAAAGVGTVGIVDNDTVERSNLQRQIIHHESDIGRSKVSSAKEYINSLNPDIAVETFEQRLDSSTVDVLIDGYDIVVDASDNFPTRYVINDYCTMTNQPFVYGAIYRFEGQVGTFTPESACYRCLFPEAPEPGTVPDCATAGVLGVLPGSIGCLQATEVIKYLTHTGELLENRLLVYDAKSMTFDSVSFQSNPDCAICSENRRIDTISAIEYSGTCSLPTH